MKSLSVFPLLASVVVCSMAHGADSPQQICDKLAEALQQEVQILGSIENAEQVKDAIAPLRKSLAKQLELFQSDNKELWEHISNTQGTELQLIELLQQLSRQFTRMEEVNYYGSEELRELLAPQIVTAD